MRILLLCLTVLLGVMVCLPMSAQAEGVDVGKAIPSDLALSDQDGKTRNFSDLTGKKGMVLVFIRSVEWCPYCQAQVKELSDNAKKFKDMGYSVVTLSYDPALKLKAFASNLKVSMPMLSDPRSDIIRTFGVLNTDVVKGTMAYGTPRPGTFIIGADKIVKAKFFKDGIKDRVTIKELTDQITKMDVPLSPGKDTRFYEIDPEGKTAPATEGITGEALDAVAPLPGDVPSPVLPAGDVQVSSTPSATVPTAQPSAPVAPSAAPTSPPANPAVSQPSVGMPEMPALDAPVMPTIDSPVVPEAAVVPTPSVTTPAAPAVLDPELEDAVKKAEDALKAAPANPAINKPSIPTTP
ncbi:MAG: redoxin domain-containing protein [Alphaproteobacteria bacterium]|nr:redoxin domain-containing protein [Alphaproteobacteria bacterium]